MLCKPAQSPLYHRPASCLDDAGWAGVFIDSGVFRECADCNLTGFGVWAAQTGVQISPPPLSGECPTRTGKGVNPFESGPREATIKSRQEGDSLPSRHRHTSPLFFIPVEIDGLSAEPTL